MIKKLFIALIVLCALSAGVLFFLIRSVDSPPQLKTMNTEATHAEEKSDETNHESAHESAPESSGHNAETSAHGAVAADSHAAPSHVAAAEVSAHPAPAPSDKVSFLYIVTEPVKAQIFSGEEKLGETPFKMVLGNEKKKLRIVSEGFESYEKEAPLKSEVGDEDQINWKISLRAKKGALTASPRGKHLPLPVPVPAAPAESEPVVTPLAKEEVKAPSKKIEVKQVEALPSAAAFHVQVEAMPFENEVQEKEAQTKLAEISKKVGPGFKFQGCIVELGAKGKWMRIIAGPFSKKNTAKLSLAKIQKRGYTAAFLTGKQECRH